MSRARVHERDPIALSTSLLDAVRSGDGVDETLDGLADLTPAELEQVRTDHRTALAFWLNVYNAATQVLVSREPERYEGLLRTWRFFRTDAVTVAGTPLTLDGIEHGLLRGSRSTLGLGYLPKLFVSEFERTYRLSEADPRIHFAVNCAAESCPPIRYYEPDCVDEQLDLATRSYLAATVEYDPDTDVATVPRLFRWYAGDFDDRVAFLREYEAIPTDADPSLSYAPWDWTMTKEKFATG